MLSRHGEVKTPSRPRSLVMVAPSRITNVTGVFPATSSRRCHWASVSAPLACSTRCTSSLPASSRDELKVARNSPRSQPFLSAYMRSVIAVHAESDASFFANRNDDPELLMEAAEWWIRTQRLDHFEKAVKIRRLVQAGQGTAD